MQPRAVGRTVLSLPWSDPATAVVAVESWSGFTGPVAVVGFTSGLLLAVPLCAQAPAAAPVDQVCVGAF
jgi:hypothetical protein